MSAERQFPRTDSLGETRYEPYAFRRVRGGDGWRYRLRVRKRNRHWVCIVSGCDRPSVPFVKAAPGAPFCEAHCWNDARA